MLYSLPQCKQLQNICKFPASAVTNANGAAKLNGKEGHFFLLY